jgi:WXG100 family type VII secretion target
MARTARALPRCRTRHGATRDGSPEMSVNYKVTPEYVSAAAASCNNTADEIQGQLAELKSYVINLEEVWQGVASNTFQIYMREYDVYSAMLHQALTDIGSGLNGTEVNYRGSEQANLNNIHKLESELPPARLG